MSHDSILIMTKLNLIWSWSICFTFLCVFLIIISNLLAFYWLFLAISSDSLTGWDVRWYELLLSLIFSHVIEVSVPKTVLVTIVKLNGSNYLLWVHASVSSSVLRTSWLTSSSLHLLLQILYVTWLTGDYSVMIWFLYSLEKKISGSIIFLTTAKKIWDTMKVMYEN